MKIHKIKIKVDRFDDLFVNFDELYELKGKQGFIVAFPTTTDVAPNMMGVFIETKKGITTKYNVFLKE